MGHILFTARKSLVTPIKYGLLYNWYAATDARNIANEGWHVPSKTEYTTLQTYLGGAGAGNKLKEIGTTYWNSPNAGTNEAAFNGRGEGSRFYSDGNYSNIKKSSRAWTTTSFNASAMNCAILGHSSENLIFGGYSYGWGHPVRLLKDSTTLTDGQTGTYIGNDGKIYRTICIGTQEWLADNLAETKFRNGDTIPFNECDDLHSFSDIEWANLETAGCCPYDNDWSNVPMEQPTGEACLVTPIKYGLLYNYYAIADEREFTSSDEWYIPQRTFDVIKLFDYLGGGSIAGGKLKETGLVYWIDTNTGATNEVGFNGRGSGYRGFTYLQRTLPIWTGTVNSSYAAWYAQMGINNTAGTSTSIQNMIIGMAVRLIRPATAPEQLLADGTACEPYTGNDGKIYRTVKIGTQVWTADNLAETKYRNGDWITGFDGGVYTPISDTDWAALTTGALCAYEDNLANV